MNQISKLVILGICYVLTIVFLSVTVSLMLAVIILYYPITTHYWIIGFSTIGLITSSVELTIKWSKDL